MNPVDEKKVGAQKSGGCMMCKFARVFGLIALVLTLVLVLLLRIPSVASIGF